MIHAGGDSDPAPIRLPASPVDFDRYRAFRLDDTSFVLTGYHRFTQHAKFRLGDNQWSWIAESLTDHLYAQGFFDFNPEFMWIARGKLSLPYTYFKLHETERNKDNCQNIPFCLFLSGFSFKMDKIDTNVKAQD